jgi:D-alanyl-D-alanine carboxypeptidase/D-alanyl-D-alanine-endopeptidase (penicillin-binding protein 4)
MKLSKPLGWHQKRWQVFDSMEKQVTGFWQKYPGGWCVVLLMISCAACSTSQPFTKSSDSGIRKVWKELNLDTRYHAGLSIYDIKKGESIFGYRDDNYFTPASTIKILTMYASLELLGEHLVAAYYTTKGDSLFIWGGGDPGTNYPNVDSSGALIDFISNADKQVFFSSDHFRTARFGKGWAWDDFPFTYQVERHTYPIYGNELWIRRTGKELIVKPAYLRPFISLTPKDESRLQRKESGESFEYKYNPAIGEEVVHAPIAFLKNDIARIWSEATGKSIGMLDLPFELKADSVHGSSRDTLLRIMMQESDNFIAEQLLLACSMRKLGFMNETSIIDEVRHTSLSDVDDYIQWVDGSGLSRYNLVTPRSIVAVLRKIYDRKGMPYVKEIFPAGGKSGTLKQWYASPSGEPYVFAKTGSLRNQHCLSGYLVTRRGRILVFSFMHNQFVEETAAIRSNMDKLFRYLYDKY